MTWGAATATMSSKAAQLTIASNLGKAASILGRRRPARGGDGNDMVFYSGRSANVTADPDGVADDGETNEHDNIGTDVENIWSGMGHDVLTGSSAANVLQGGFGNDVIAGGGGDDTLRGDGENDVLDGGEGNDDVAGSFGDDALQDSAGAECFLVEGQDSLDYSQRTGDVFVDPDGVADDGESGEGDNVAGDFERITTGSGNDDVVAGTGASVLDGGAGNDLLRGSARGDELRVRGDDVLEGNAGDDSLTAEPGADTVAGGDGWDQIDYSARTGSVTVMLDDVADDGAAGEGDNAGSDVERATGGSGDDTSSETPCGTRWSGVTATTSSTDAAGRTACWANSAAILWTTRVAQRTFASISAGSPR